MSEVIHADIFFFIASIATILIALGVLVGVYFIVRILRDVSEMTARLNRASRKLEDDFDMLRREVRAEGAKVRTIADLALSFVLGRLQKRRPARRQKTEDETLQ